MSVPRSCAIKSEKMRKKKEADPEPTGAPSRSTKSTAMVDEEVIAEVVSKMTGVPLHAS